MTEVSFSLGSTTPPAICTWLCSQYYTWIPAYGEGLLSNETSVDYPQWMKVSLLHPPVVIIFWASHCCCSWALQLTWTIVWFSPLHGVFWYHESSLQGEDFQISSCSITPSLMSKVCHIFSNSNLSSRSVRQYKAMVITYIILRVSWTTLNNN